MKKILNVINNILVWQAAKLPHAFVLIAFVILGLKVNRILTSGGIDKIIPVFLTFIGLEIAFASVSFSFANSIDSENDNKKIIVDCGHMFLYSAVILVIVLAMGWFTSTIELYQKTYFPTIQIKLITGFILGSASALLIFAAGSTATAIQRLEERLFPAIRDKI